MWRKVLDYAATSVLLVFAAAITGVLLGFMVLALVRSAECIESQARLSMACLFG